MGGGKWSHSLCPRCSSKKFRKGRYAGAGLSQYIIPTTKLKTPRSTERIKSVKMVLCTLASLSNKSVEKRIIFTRIPLRNLIVDEASQIDMTSDFMVIYHLLITFLC